MEPTIDLSKVFVAPHWGAWIEMVSKTYATKDALVAPHWGAWIEILWCRATRM